MRLYLLRHAPAAERDAARWPDDRERPLTARGRARMREAALGVAAIGVSPAAILSSPLARALQTARLLARALSPSPPITFHPELEPASPPARALSLLADPRGDEIVLVGHEPHLSTLAAFLIGGREPSAFDLRKGGLCRIDFEGDPAPGSGRLIHLLTPRLLRRLGRAGGREPRSEM